MYSCLWCNKEFEEMPKDGVCPYCHHDQFLALNMIREIQPGGIFVKLSSRAVIESIRNGNVWFNSPKYYQEYKGNPAICDVHECEFDYLEHKDGKIVGTVSNTQNWNRLFCFYFLGMQEDHTIIIPDEKIKSFGDCFAAVNYKALQKKLLAWCKSNNYEFTFTGVKYSSANYEGPYNPTFKDDSYKYQNEWRFIIRSEQINALPEKEAVKEKFDDMENIFTESKPIDLLFEKQTLEELADKCGWEK